MPGTYRVTILLGTTTAYPAQHDSSIILVDRYQEQTDGNTRSQAAKFSPYSKCEMLNIYLLSNYRYRHPYLVLTF